MAKKTKKRNLMFTLIAILLIVIQPIVVAQTYAPTDTAETKTTTDATDTTTNTGITSTTIDTTIETGKINSIIGETSEDNTEELPEDENKLGKDFLILMKEKTAAQAIIEKIQKTGGAQKPAHYSHVKGVRDKVITKKTGKENTNGFDEKLNAFVQKVQSKFKVVSIDTGSIIHWLRHKAFSYKPSYDNIFNDETREDLTTMKSLQVQADRIEQYINSGTISLDITRLNTIFDDIIDEEGNINEDLNAEATGLVEELKELGAKEAAENYEEYLGKIREQSQIIKLYKKQSELFKKMNSPNYDVSNFNTDKNQLLDVTKQLEELDAISEEDVKYVKDFTDNFLKSFNKNREASDKNILKQREQQAKEKFGESLVDLFGLAEKAQNYAPQESKKAQKAIREYEKGNVKEEDAKTAMLSLIKTLQENPDKISKQQLEEVMRGQNIEARPEISLEAIKTVQEKWNTASQTELTKLKTNALQQALQPQAQINKDIFSFRANKNIQAKCGLLTSIALGLNLIPGQNIKLIRNLGCELTSKTLTQNIVISPKKLKVYAVPEARKIKLKNKNLLYINPLGLTRINEITFPDTDNDGLLDQFDPDPETPNTVPEAPTPTYPEEAPAEAPTPAEAPEEKPEEEVPEEVPEEEIPKEAIPPLEDYFEELPTPTPPEPEKQL
ncbi:hypothetical protein DRJ22_03390, partial [Candidatus Woesearchaeota archaeon]